MRGAKGNATAGWARSARAGGVAGLMLLSLSACSSSRESGSSGLQGSTAAPQHASQAPPSGYDNDGPPPRSTDQVVYRGGRDPVSGRAAEWPPAAPQGGSQIASAPPQPQPGYGAGGYPAQGGYPPAQGYEPEQRQMPPPGYGQPPYPASGYQPPPAQQPYPPPQAYQPAPAQAPAQPYLPPPQQAYRQPGAPVGGGPATVEVRKGDTLYRIARAHNVTVADLMQANGLQSQTIKEGQRLTIPAR